MFHVTYNNLLIMLDAFHVLSSLAHENGHMKGTL